ncbi:hypothetical protein TL5118_00386 [Thalassovita autumnalis]|uniref:Uncharacterized protein n=1 Tax=Thalassovita autumnalis TaxID=2072972 RepID=A0A0P1F5U3_9RHOB|nr:hypothetical protein [Thalassovita autumnalis]CUH63241.1 hypothetical protein TL5118_00386 [Thalassovita autumnalis]CUH72009.1 hypothetical protein TL5120_01805 [Thalassovita autumnalis]
MTLTKDDLNAAIERISDRSDAAATSKSRLAWASLVFSIFATVAGGISAGIANGNKAKLEKASQDLLAGQARLQLIEASFKHLERMVDGTTSEARHRACNVALELGLVELESGKSSHIITLHQKYLDMRPSVDVTASDLCRARSDDAAANAKARGILSETVVPAGEGQLAPQVVVMASYRLGKCKTAGEARGVLADYFARDLKGGVVQVALSPSQHYGVVYNPTTASLPLQDFLATARAKGRAVHAAVEAREDTTTVEKQNIQYVRDAYVANTEGWELISTCPKDG